MLVAEDGAALVAGPDAVIVADPYLAFARISALFHPRPSLAPGVDPRALVEPGAQIAPSATVMAFAFVGRGARIGARAAIYPQVFVGEGSVVGEDAVLYPHVVVRERCSVGARVVLQPGAVVGGDGFGFAFDAARPEHVKIAQAGAVEVQDNVEVGANSAIDRATSGATVIGRGSKIDNLVQIGHNVQVGPLCVLCGQVGLAGSSKLGRLVVCGGQVGIANHVCIADGSRIGAQSGIKDDIDAPGDYVGAPVQPSGRVRAREPRLPARRADAAHAPPAREARRRLEAALAAKGAPKRRRKSEKA